MTVHEFKTISDTGSSQITIKASKFLGYTWHVTSAEQIGKWLDSIRSQHKKATHHCYAWRLGLSANDFRANDDGEPSGSAGRPILGQIDSKDLTDIFVVVVRYYGGTKLGVPGLISAYKQAILQAKLRLRSSKKGKTDSFIKRCGNFRSAISRRMYVLIQGIAESRKPHTQSTECHTSFLAN